MRRPRPGPALAALAVLVAAGAGVSLAVVAAGGDGGGSSAVPAAAATARVELKLPLDRAAAQLFVVGFGGTSGDAASVRRLAERDWGGVMIERHNATSADQVGALARAIRERAIGAGMTAPLMAMTQAGGDASALPGLPPVPEGDQAVAREAAAQATAAARALRPLGIEITLAPVADLANAVGPAADTGFSADPERAADLVAAAVHAYRLAGLASAPGSFPGQGGASQDPREGPATVGFDLATLRAADVRPFAAAAAEAPIVQMSDAVYAAWDGVTPATLAPEAYDLLRRGAHFGGVALSGDLTAATAVTGGTPAQAAIEALRAGADLLWVPGDAADQEAAYQAMLVALRQDPELRSRAAQALARVGVLRARYATR